MRDYTKIEEYIDISKIRYNEPMRNHTTIRIGGPADVLVIPTSIEDVKQVLKFVKEYQVPMIVIGNGSKIVVLDEGIRGIVLKLGNKFSDCEVKGEEIFALAGVSVPRLAIIAKDNTLSGLEFAAGIPASLGGAICMNAGAYDGEMADITEEVTYIDEDLNLKTMQKADLEFSYRSSYFRKNEDKGYVIVSAKLRLKKGEQDEISKIMNTNNESRRTKQPLEYPTAGSTFKRPEGYFVGKLIDDSNLRGYRVGDAQVSQKHSGFIVNLGNATAKDVISVIEHIKKEVYKKFNVMLEEEIIFLGGNK